jgi:hypothetical protein
MQIEMPSYTPYENNSIKWWIFPTRGLAEVTLARGTYIGFPKFFSFD